MYTNNWFFILSILGLIVYPCCTSIKKTAPTKMTEQIFSLPEWAKHANIYEVNIRQYTPEGTFNAFRKHLPRLQKMGVEILWFMPVYPISTTKKKGSLGSYYAVSDFRSTNPKFGTINEFKAIIDEAHKLGMKVILDWVPNHTGWDHVWIKNHPDFYTRNDKGEIIDPLNERGESMGWADVADLNYNNPELWEAMKNDMLFWVEKYKVDGFRQDMAMLVPLDFWIKTNSALLKNNPNLFLLAESEEHDHINKDCFHAFYAWSLHHTLNDIANGKKTASAIDDWRQNTLTKLQKGLYMHFTTNHDENSWSGSEIERMKDAYKAMAVLTYTLDGIPLVYSGQEEPLVKRLEFFEKDTIPFSTYSNADFYTLLNKTKKENESLWNHPFGGELQRIMKDEHVYAFIRTKGNNQTVTIINLSGQHQKVLADIDYAGTNIFTGNKTTLSKGREFLLSPWQYFILVPNQ
ncbi:MAG: alpha-amylase [Saprospiraceae bacterium]|nr:alpha-amylase [Saprospiraceae bacterium]MBK8082262.1 alpha-amylase [Saprospiraceae bacterium]MBK8820523.1 alpha-amylase [Saprospiraceae bacterium]